MPNNKYLRSRRREQEIVNDAHKKGVFLAARTAGSKSKGYGFKTDVILIDAKDKLVRLVQVKTKKGGRGLVKRDHDILSGFTLITSTFMYA